MKLDSIMVLVAFLILGVTASAQEPPPADPFCPPTSWNKSNATSNLESLIKGQMDLIADFDSLLHEYGKFNGSMNATFLASYEDLLRKQSVLHINYADMLGNQSNWSFSSPSDQIKSLTNYTQILSEEKALYGDFFDLLNATWCESDFKTAEGICPDINTHREFLYSFQDLLTRQTSLLTYYYYLTKNLDPAININYKIGFISDYEGLIRWHSLKILDLEILMKNPCTEYS